MSGTFVVSLDFELLWGVRDHADKNSYGENIRGARDAIPRPRSISENDIKATWATVGFLFCEDKEELMASLPETRANYNQADYPIMNTSMRLEKTKRMIRITSLPLWFRLSPILPVRKSARTRCRISTVLKMGQRQKAFEADIVAARQLAERRGIYAEVYRVSQDQYAPEHLAICERGLTTYRGNPSGWAYRAGKGTEQTKWRRALRLLDAHTSALARTRSSRLAGYRKTCPRVGRPCAGQLAPFHPLHVATIKRGMTQAAKSGTGYHLWWHPHNFGRDLGGKHDEAGEIVATLPRLAGGGDAFPGNGKL